MTRKLVHYHRLQDGFAAGPVCGIKWDMDDPNLIVTAVGLEPKGHPYCFQCRLIAATMPDRVVKKPRG